MKENKTEKYTFGPEEKDTLEILGLFEQELDDKLEESESEVQKVKYYETFQINEVNFNNIFITTEKDAEGNITYHVYCGDSSNEILSINSEGNVDVKNSQLAPFLLNVDLEEMIKQNEKEPGKLKGISEKAEPEEIMERLQKTKDSKDGSEQGNLEKEEEEAQKETDDEKNEKPEEQIEKDLNGENQEDLGISYYRQIKDANFEEQIGMNLKGYQEIGLAYSKTKNAFIFVGKKDGHYQQVEGFELAQPTYKTVISIDEKGENIEEKVPHAIMETSNPEKEVSITIGQYGYIEVGTLDRLPCNKRVERQVREQGKGIEGQENAEITREFATEGKYYGDEIAHKREILEREYDVTETDLEELKDLDIEALIEEEADRVKISKEGFKRYVKEASGKTLKEKISNAQDEIIEEYMGHGRPRSN